ncbi:MAG: PQQ-dependent sugar dehydrogenase [Solirubrobacterales bacterium]
MRRAFLLTATVVPAFVLVLIGASSAHAQSVQLVPFGGQSYALPYYVAGEPGDPSRVYVVEAAGTIRLVENGVTRPTPFLEISSDVLDGGERGLFSMALAPDYATSGLFYVFFTRAATSQHDLVIREFRRTTDPDDIDEGTGRDVIVIPHPDASNHNGGQLQFGPDGLLYISTGDGGSTPNLARSLNSRLGKILRINPAGTSPGEYSIPAGNPFDDGVGGPNADEIYSYGLRNPYRFSFDRLTGDLAIGDVGQSAWEEVDFLANGAGLGANFGWNCFEGVGAYSGAPPGCTAPPSPHTPPVLQYENPPDSGAAINGGYVVRDETLPSLFGRYLYADSSGAFPEIRSALLFPGGSSGDSSTGLSGGTASFGEDACGHIYVAQFSGQVSRIQTSGAAPPCQPQTALPLPGPGADTRGPALSVDLSKAKRAAARGQLTLIVGCDEACTVSGGGEVVLPGKDIGLDPDGGFLAAGIPGALHLELSGKETRRVRAALLDGEKVKAGVELSAADAAGNRSVAQRRIKQKR